MFVYIQIDRFFPSTLRSTKAGTQNMFMDLFLVLSKNCNQILAKGLRGPTPFYQWLDLRFQKCQTYSHFAHGPKTCIILLNATGKL